ncbi:7-cyano-7-deazaguanine synthase [Sorangium sp. So ce136]|uniref:7-cyano-7-deazaguanine synthase n=1 Tax=Sorangium sp. So ce136 TaxID=3133284 RepID=UPI003F52900E
MYRHRSASVSALFVDYGQPAAAQEHAAGNRVALHYEVPLVAVGCHGLGRVGAGYVRARNALLLQIALAAAPFDAGHIAIGLHAGTPYADCSPSFVVEMQRCFDIYCDGKIRVVAPFLDEDKPAIVAFCHDRGVPIDLTYSCERGTTPACGACLSCLDRKALNVF